MIHNHAAGAISAHSEGRNEDENIDNNRKMLAYLLHQGYAVIKIKGGYVENFDDATKRRVGEVSFLVMNKRVEGDDKGQLEADLIRLGHLFDQDYVFSIPFQRKAALVHVRHKISRLKESSNRIEFKTPSSYENKFVYISFGNQFKIVFQVLEPIELPFTINGVRAMKMMATSVQERLVSEA